MATVQGSARNTLSGQDARGLSDVERAMAQGAAMARSLLDLYTTPSVPASVDFAGLSRTLTADAEGSVTPPEDLPVPSRPSGLNLAAGLIGTALGGLATRQGPAANQQAFAAARGMGEAADAVEATNVAQQNQFRLARQMDMLELRRTLLLKQAEQEVANQNFKNAAKAQQEAFVVQTAIDQLQGAQTFRRQQTLQAQAGAQQLQVAKVSGILDFISRLPAGQNTSGGLDPEQESKEFKDLMSFINEADLKIEDNQWTWTRGKIPNDEETAIQFRTAASFLTSPSPRVRSTSLWVLQSILQRKFGDDVKKKNEFLVQNGLEVLVPQEGQ